MLSQTRRIVAAIIAAVLFSSAAPAEEKTAAKDATAAAPAAPGPEPVLVPPGSSDATPVNHAGNAESAGSKAADSKPNGQKTNGKSGSRHRKSQDRKSKEEEPKPKGDEPKPAAATAKAQTESAGLPKDIFEGRPVEKLSLVKAIEMALQNNLDVKFERTGIGIQRAQVKFAAGAFDPVFTMIGQHQETRQRQDLNNPSTTTEINQQQQLQLQLNQAAQQLNADVINSQQQVIRANQQANAVQQQINQANQTLALQGLSGLSVSTAPLTTPTQIPVVPIITPNLNNLVILDQVNTQFQVALQGRTSIGTRFSFQATENEMRNTFTGNLAPVKTLYETFVGLNIQQPLLKNFGKDANLADLRAAKVNAKVQTLNWKQNIATSIQGVMAAYYDMVYAIQDMQVRESAIAADSKLVALYQRRVELGFGSPFDIRQAEVAVSTDREALLVSKNTFLERQFALKRLILANFEVGDPRLFLPESVPNLTPPPIDRMYLLQTAFQNRYDYRATLLNADVQDIRLRFAKNQLLPELDLVGTYGFNGLDYGVDTSINNTFEAHNPQWSIGLQFQVPIGNRQPRAQYEAILGQKEQAILKIKQSEIAVGVDVDTIISRIETYRQRLEAARKTRELGEEAVRIAYRRVEEGQISAYDITEQQRKLYDAKSRELAAIADINKAVTQLWLVTGTVLQRQGIDFHEPSDTYTPPPPVPEANGAIPASAHSKKR